MEAFKKITDINELKLKANRIRKEIIIMLEKAGSGHSAGPLGMADIFSALYFNVMNHNPKKPWEENRDRMILCNGHICPVLYPTLALAGYFPLKELSTLRKINSRLQGHPHYQSVPGIENSSGPLGQGSSMAAGIAIGAKIYNKKFRVYLVLSDGELNEGQPWESFLFAAKYKLDNIIAIVDRNNIQIDGKSDDIMPLNPLDLKFKAFGWHVIKIDGHNMKEILSAFKKAKAIKGKPTVIIANTIPGKGISFMENDYNWHGKPPNTEEANLALEELEKIEIQLRT